MLAPAAAARPAQYPAPARELLVPVQGGRVYVRINGSADAQSPPVLAIHGGPGGTHASLLDLLDLAGERMVVLYDQLDCGRSDRPNDPANWTVGRFVDEIEAIRAALGVSRWHVLGHSWGGAVALEYGARRPAALAGLVLASPLISTKSWLSDANALRGRLPAEVQADLVRCESAAPPPEARCDAATGAFYQSFNRREPLSQARRAYTHPEDRGVNLDLYRHMWGGSEFVSTGTLKDYDGAPLLARLDGPRTLLLVGQHDEARPITAMAFAEQAPGAELGVIPGAAHDIFNDRADETTALLRAWLRR